MSPVVTADLGKYRLAIVQGLSYISIYTRTDIVARVSCASGWRYLRPSTDPIESVLPTKCVQLEPTKHH